MKDASLASALNTSAILRHTGKIKLGAKILINYP